MPDFTLPTTNLSSIAPSVASSFSLPTVYLPNLPNLPFLNWGPALPKPLPQPLPPPNLWGVFGLGTTNPVFDVDSCVSLDFDKSNKDSSFPVENGSFANYNKVVEPSTITIRLAVSGAARLQALETSLLIEVDDINLYNIRTPEYIYIGQYNLEKVKFIRTKEKGAYTLFADTTWIEIRQVAAAYTTVQQPAVKSKSSKSASKY